jgi:hypothetical protein
MQYAPDNYENMFTFFGWNKNQRLPNGIIEADKYSEFEGVCMATKISQISTCKNATLILKEDKTLQFCGKIKDKNACENYALANPHFESPVKLISAGRMTLAVVLDNN